MTFSSAAAASPAAASTAAAAAITNQCPRTVPRTLLAAVALLSAAAAVVSFAGPHMAGSAFKLSKGKKIPDVVVDVTAPDVEKLRKVLGMAKDIWTVDQSTLTATLVVPAHKMGDVGNELEGQMNVKVEDLEKSMMKNWHEVSQQFMKARVGGLVRARVSIREVFVFGVVGHSSHFVPCTLPCLRVWSCVCACRLCRGATRVPAVAIHG